MDPRLLKYYNRELSHLREMGGEFAAEFPKIAGRLSLDEFECADPYVERLLEGFAFLAARLQMRMDAEFPRFTQHLFEMVFPHHVRPIPSLAVVQMRPDLKEGALAQGFVVPRNSPLRGILAKGEATACEYRTAHDVTLFPLELVEAQYVSRDSAGVELPDVPGLKAAIRIRLRATAGLPLNKLQLDRLPLFIRGMGERPMQIYEQIMAGCAGIALRPISKPAAPASESWQIVLPRTTIRPVGFADDQGLLPAGPRSFQGYRLLAEYFACPQRFMFFELTGLAPAIGRLAEPNIDVFILLDRYDSQLEAYVGPDSFALFCTPAVNLFPRTCDRIHLTDHAYEHHVIVDRTRPIDFEVFSISELVGYGTEQTEEQTFLPFYATTDLAAGGGQEAYYTMTRTPRVLSTNQRKVGPRSSYIGSEVYISLVDGKEAPYDNDLKQLAVKALCTNRDLPLHMPIGKGASDFTLETGAPVESIRCLAGPTRPRPSPMFSDGDFIWRLVSHLTLNYLSLIDTDQRQGASALRDLLKLYGDVGDAPTRKQIEGVRNVRSQTITRRIPTSGPITFGRGVEVNVSCDEAAFEGTGIFLLGAVLEQFFARYVSINSFTETVLSSADRGEVMRWPARIGRRQIA
jgi:type VI secretion system protein ImpG